MNLENVTMVIPAHNRPERLRRLLHYYNSTNIRVVVPDSSESIFPDVDKYPDTVYFHNPNVHFLKKSVRHCLSYKQSTFSSVRKMILMTKGIESGKNIG